MCLLLIAYHVHANYPLVIAANRDEFYQRPTKAAHFWPQAPQVLAGQDLQAGGTWLGISRSGRFAGLTNIREMPMPAGQAPSRGLLVSDYLRGTTPPQTYFHTVAQKMLDYPGFNLLVGDEHELWYLANRGSPEPQRLAPGVYGLSNHLLNTPWPKVRHGRDMLSSVMERKDDVSADAMFAMLSYAELFPDEQLPDTGVGLALERMLSPLFIQSERYGTCCSTIIKIAQDGLIHFHERTTNPLSPSPAVDMQFHREKHEH